MTSKKAEAWEKRIKFVRRHFERKGYRVLSGLQFGCELVLYADDPSKVHSDFCVHVIPEDGLLDWPILQTLVRSMPDLHKTLILANLTFDNDGNPVIDEIAMTSEHAPFRHRKHVAVGHQRKRQKTTDKSECPP